MQRSFVAMFATGCVLCALVSLTGAGISLGDDSVTLWRTDHGPLELTLEPRQEALQMSLNFEGRGKKDSSALMHVFLGYKMAAMATLLFSLVGALVMKALGVAKIAAVTAMILLISKLFKHKESARTEVTEIETPEVYVEDHNFTPAISEDGYGVVDTSGYYSYANLKDLTGAETSTGNVTHSQVQQVSRRRDVTRHKKIPLLTIREYTAKSL